MARLSSELILSLKDRVTGPARRVDTAMDRLRRNASRSAMGVERGTRAAGRMGMMMGGMGLGAMGAAGGIAAVGLGARSTVTQAADFESALTGIQKKAGTTAEETRALGDEIQALATSGELATSIDEIAAAYERGAAAGIPVDKLREFAALSAKAADAFEMSAEDVGNAAAGFATNLDIPISGMERYFDLINGLADAGIADESDIVSFLDRAGVQLKTFGQSREQAAALGATLLNLKMPTEVAARAMNTLSTKLLTPKATAESTEAFNQLYGSADVFTEMLKEDANGALIDFLDRIGELDKFQRAELLTGILGQGFSDEVSRLASGIDEYRRNLEYAADEQAWFNSLDKSYQLKLDDFWSQWQLVKNEVTSLAIDLGNGGMPALKSSLQTARGLVEEIGDGLDSFKANVDLEGIHDAQDAVGNLAAQIGDLMGMGGEGTAIGRFFERISGLVNGISDSINVIEDTAQGMGLAPQDDDTAADRKARRDRLADGIASIGPPTRVLGNVYDETTGRNIPNMTHADVGNLQAALTAVRELVALQDRMQNPENPLGAPSPSEIMERRRALQMLTRRLPQSTVQGLSEYRSALSSGAGDASAIAERLLADMIAAHRTRAGQWREPVNPPRPTSGFSSSTSNAPAPRPRPQDLGSVMEREGERATRAAQQAGRDIETALSLETRPRIDMREIDDALRKVAQLSSRLRAIPGETRQAQTAVAAMDARSARTTSAELRNQFSDAVVG